MYPETSERAKEIFAAISRGVRGIKKTEVVICPPSVYLPIFKKSKSKIFSLGAQNVFWEMAGAYTGEVSTKMLSEFGAKFVIVGHSERRRLGETDEAVSKKVSAVIRAGLKAIICIGESERDVNGAYFEFLKNQIKNSLSGLRPADLQKIIIAYEPIWTIGKSYNDAMKPSDIHEMSLYIKKLLSDMYSKEIAFKVPVIYGGSAEVENAFSIMSEGQVDGLLVGHKSLVPEDFIKIVKAADVA